MTAAPDITTIDLLALMGGDFKKIASTRGGEWAGPCPICKTGKDRCHIQPAGGADGRGVWMCSYCTGDRTHWSDALGFIAKRDSLDLGARADYLLACERLGVAVSTHEQQARDPQPPEPCEPPSAIWQGRARAFAEWSEQQLWAHTEKADAVLAYLECRGLLPETIKHFGLGFNPKALMRPRGPWGLGPRPDGKTTIYLAAGIVIPWVIDGDLWQINIRRSPGSDPKYLAVEGSIKRCLYNADEVGPDWPVVLVEGDFDAMLVHQEASDICSAIAAGSTTGGQHPRWLARLSRAAALLIAFDGGAGEEEKGETAARYWLSVFPEQARRWRTYAKKDPTEFYQAGYSIREWVTAGLDEVLG